MRYVEFDACVSCGLDLWKWENNEYSSQFKEYVIAFHNMKSLIDMHTEDAKSKELEKKSRQAKRGRG